MIMIKLNIHEIKSQFSKYVDLVEGGETVIICKRNLPVAEIRPIPRPGRRKPRLGAAKGTFVIPPAFYEPLPEAELEAFEGKAEPPKK
jgi:prevent-host-death family protein